MAKDAKESLVGTKWARNTLTVQLARPVVTVKAETKNTVTLKLVNLHYALVGGWKDDTKTIRKSTLTACWTKL